MARVRIRAFPLLTIIFLIVPIIEIYLLIQVGGVIGVLPTIGLVVLTAVIGVALLRAQGLQTYLRLNQAMGEGRLPATEILEGVALLIGGALLLTPGFFTDFIGFICLIPITRQGVILWFTARYAPLSGLTVQDFETRRRSGNVYDGKVTRRHEDE